MDEKIQSSDPLPEVTNEESKAEAPQEIKVEESTLNEEFGSTEKQSRATKWTVLEEDKDNQVIDIDNIEDRGQTQGNMLYRHPADKMVGGVCAGLADYLEWDPALMRILWVGATLATFGGGFLAYLALWLLLPVGTRQNGQVKSAALSINERNSSTLAYLLIGVGIVILLSNVEMLSWLAGGAWAAVSTLFWPAVMIGLGFMLLNSAGGKDWRQSVRTAGQNFRTNFSGKMPSGQSVRNNLKKTRSRLPLRRTSTDKIMLGVCGGISRKIGIDANLVRIGWVAITVFSGGFFGIAAYIALGLILPEENSGIPRPQREVKDVQIL
ncbi:MAG: PspC domain-containing protein [Chloroflexota bacterium]